MDRVVGDCRFFFVLAWDILVRSGVLTSVHAFASDPKRGVFILIFLAVVVGSSLSLFAWRAPRVTLGGRMELVSRESFLLANSVLLVVATGAVLLGTIYPLIIDALNMGKLSVGPQYFNAVFAPLLVPTVFLMVPGTIARWREAKVSEIAYALRFSGFASLVLAVGLPFVLGGWSFGAMLGIFLGAWVGLGTLQQVVTRLRKPGRIGLSFWGQTLRTLVWPCSWWA